MKLTICVLIAFAWFAILLGNRAAPAAAPHAMANPVASSLYLPLVTRGNRDGGPVGDVTACFWLPFQTADNSYVTLYGPSVAVDGNGGIHIAYTSRAGQDAGHRPAYYLYCPVQLQ